MYGYILRFRAMILFFLHRIQSVLPYDNFLHAFQWLCLSSIYLYCCHQWFQAKDGKDGRSAVDRIYEERKADSVLGHCEFPMKRGERYKPSLGLRLPRMIHDFYSDRWSLWSLPSKSNILLFFGLFSRIFQSIRMELLLMPCNHGNK